MQNKWSNQFLDNTNHEILYDYPHDIFKNVVYQHKDAIVRLTYLKNMNCK